MEMEIRSLLRQGSQLRFAPVRNRGIEKPRRSRCPGRSENGSGNSTWSAVPSFVSVPERLPLMNADFEKEATAGTLSLWLQLPLRTKRPPSTRSDLPSFRKNCLAAGRSSCCRKRRNLNASLFDRECPKPHDFLLGEKAILPIFHSRWKSRKTRWKPLSRTVVCSTRQTLATVRVSCFHIPVDSPNPPLPSG